MCGRMVIMDSNRRLQNGPMYERPSELPNHFKEKKIDSPVLELILKLLIFNHEERPTAEKAILDKYFIEYPKPTGPVSIKKH